MEPRSIRLNAKNREAFIDKVLYTIMPPSTRPTTAILFKSWESKIYSYIYGPFEKEIAALPVWMKTKSKTILVSMGGNVRRFEMDREEITLENGVFLASGVECFQPVCHLDEHDLLTLEYKGVIQQAKDWDIKRSILAKELKNVVHACNTSAQLYLAWPQALQFAHCFIYTGNKATPRSKISVAALDLTLNITKSIVEPSSEN